MGEEVEHNCYLCISRNFHDAYVQAQSLSHRGRDSTGIIAVKGDKIDCLKIKGPINSMRHRSIQNMFPAQNYDMFAVHGRYKTKGSVDINLDEGHPHTIGGTVVDRGSHRFIFDCELAMMHNGQVRLEDLAGIDHSLLRTKCDTEALAHYYHKFGPMELLNNVPASYTLVAADKKSPGFKVIRDRFEVKPGCIGKKDSSQVMASESAAFLDIGATFSHDLRGGIIYEFGNDYKFKPRRILAFSDPARCFFEYNYIASPRSIIDETSVLAVRRALGEELADELDFLDLDFVSYIPESPSDAASAFAQKRGIPFLETFYKMRDERSFQGATQTARENSIGGNLFLLPKLLCNGELHGKKGLWIDDSIVRGTVSKLACKFLTGAGVKDIHLASYTPKIGIVGDDGVLRGCDRGGVDMPSQENEYHKFLARNKTAEQINEEVGCHVHYISMEGMLRAYGRKGINSSELCTFCIGGRNRFVK